VAQLLTTSFRRTMAVAVVIGVIVCVVGLSITYWQPQSPGATIVILAIAIYAVVAAVRPLIMRRRGESRDPHPDILDDVTLDQGAAACSE
jgi:zinc transport system permease protein